MAAFLDTDLAGVSLRNTIEIMFGDARDQAARTEWVKICSADGEDGYDTYVDTATIRGSGDTAKMWHLHDFRTAQVARGVVYRSAKNWVEYDFARARRRMLYFAWSGEPMGNGATVYQLDEPSPWRPILPGSIAAMLGRIAKGLP